MTPRWIAIGAIAATLGCPLTGVVAAAPPGEPTPLPGDVRAVVDAADHVPDNPAIDLLGAETLKVAKPGSIKDLDVELRTLYKDGKVVPEIALELSPWALTLGRASSYRDYLERPAIRWLRRFTVSVATTSLGDGDAQTTLGALGVRLRLIDDTDWRLNGALVDCALAAIELPVPGAPPGPDGGDGPIAPGPEPAPDTAKQIERCIADHAQPWNATQLAVGAALSSAFPQSKLRWDLHDLVAWAAYARPAGANGGVTLGLKYLYNDARTVDAMAQPAHHTLAATANYELRRDKLGLVASVGVGSRWSRAEMAPSAPHAVGLLGAELQVQIASDTWLALRFSGDLVSGSSELISLANLKWNYDITPTRSN